MKRFFVVICFLFVSSNLWSFNYFGVGFGPNFHIRGDRPSNYLIQAEWQPHKIVGARMFVGFRNGFWIGTAINFKQSMMRAFHYSYWDINFSIPIIFNIQQYTRSAFIGVTANTTFSFDITGKGVSYFYLTPVEIMFTPFIWSIYPTSSVSKDMSVSYMFSVGFRRAI